MFGAISNMRTSMGAKSDFILVLMMLCILMVLFTPIPPVMLDVLLVANFSFGILVLLLTFYTDKPLEFSTFPSVLLIATLFRLSLNVAATRLILSDAHAGEVISSIGTYVVGGNYVIGLVVFLILIVVQYVVITNGAQRVAEVAARFTLDAMPGKQMSIDADMNMGLIDEHEARDRRMAIEKEANFYGAMDGASKFVKGDAIAGIIIILVDIIGGLTIGLAQKGMDWGDALYTYTLLTVGDGIVTQIPALVISTATGIIITRAATDSKLGGAISRQIAQQPKTLVFVCFGLLIAAFIPGIPLFPVMSIFTLFAVITFIMFRAAKERPATDEETAAADAEEKSQDIYSGMSIEAIEVSVGQGLAPLLGDSEGVFVQRMQTFRKRFSQEIGLVIPKLKLRDDPKMSPESYEVCIHGARVGEGVVRVGKLLAINPDGKRDVIDGEATKDPSFGLNAIWIDEDAREAAKTAGYTVVDPLTVMTTHFTELVRAHAAQLLSRAEVEKLIENCREHAGGLVDEVVPNVMSLTDVQKIMQALLAEKVSIRNVELILEVLSENAKANLPHESLVEKVREKLGPAICQAHISQSGQLAVISLEPQTEHAFRQALRPVEGQGGMLADPQMTERLIESLATHVSKMISTNRTPVLLCSPALRPHMRKLTERLMPRLHVLSLAEVPSNIKIESMGLVGT